MLLTSTIKKACRFAGVLVLMALLVFLTTVNFVLYSSSALSEKATTAAVSGDSSQNGAFPDEKTPGNPNSISEEFLHEPEDLSTLTLTISNSFPIFTSTALLSRALSFVSPPPDQA